MHSITSRTKPAPSSTTCGSMPKAATSGWANTITGTITIAASTAATMIDCPSTRSASPTRAAPIARATSASVPVPTAVMVTATPPRICAPTPTAATDGAPSRATNSMSTSPTSDSDSMVMITGQASDQMTPRECPTAPVRSAGRSPARIRVLGSPSMAGSGASRQVNPTAQSIASTARRACKRACAELSCASACVPARRAGRSAPTGRSGGEPMRKKRIDEQIAAAELSRREFLAGLGAAAGALALGGCSDASGGDPENEPLPDPRELGDRARRRPDDGEPLLRPLPRLAPGRRRHPVRPRVRRQAGQPARDLSARAGVAGLPVRRPRPRLPRRTRPVRRRRVRRLAAGVDRRPVPDRLLPAGGPVVLRRRGARLDDLRPLLLLDHELDLPEPHVPARGPDRPHPQLARRRRRMPAIWDRIAAAGLSGALLLQRPAGDGAVRLALPADLVPLREVPRGRGQGAARQRGRTSIRTSSARSSAPRTTTTRSPTSATARSS